MLFRYFGYGLVIGSIIIFSCEAGKSKVSLIDAHRTAIGTHGNTLQDDRNSRRTTLRRFLRSTVPGDGRALTSREKACCVGVCAVILVAGIGLGGGMAYERMRDTPHRSRILPTVASGSTDIVCQQHSPNGTYGVFDSNSQTIFQCINGTARREGSALAGQRCTPNAVYISASNHTQHIQCPLDGFLTKLQTQAEEQSSMPNLITQEPQAECFLDINNVTTCSSPAFEGLKCLVVAGASSCPAEYFLGTEDDLDCRTMEGSVSCPQSVFKPNNVCKPRDCSLPYAEIWETAQGLAVLPQYISPHIPTWWYDGGIVFAKTSESAFKIFPQNIEDYLLNKIKTVSASVVSIFPSSAGRSRHIIHIVMGVMADENTASCEYRAFPIFNDGRGYPIMGVIGINEHCYKTLTSWWFKLLPERVIENFIKQKLTKWCPPCSITWASNR